MSHSVRELAIGLAGDFGLSAKDVTPLGGGTGLAWGVGDHIMRISSRAQADLEAIASATAAKWVPVPSILGRVDREEVSAVLIQRLPGTVGWSEEMSVRSAERRGEALGTLHERIARAPAPEILPRFVPEIDADRLMHFDIHPFNVLFDENDEIIGVIDWANPLAGTAEDDRARTAATLFLAPPVFPFMVHESWWGFIRGWSRTAHLDHVSGPEMVRAIEYLMYTGLSERHSPAEFAPARQALREAEEGRVERIFERLR